MDTSTESQEAEQGKQEFDMSNETEGEAMTNEHSIYYECSECGQSCEVQPQPMFTGPGNEGKWLGLPVERLQSVCHASKVEARTIPPPPPADNDHVAEGASLFPAGTTP